MISRTTFCSAQAVTIPLVGMRLDHVEDLVAKSPDQLPGVDRSDAADHAGREILLDALDRGWR
jgi:hypothetical protein